jgi:hypothetical protein
MADTRCYRNSTSNGQPRLTDVSENNTICPGTEQDDGFSRCCGNSAICLPNNICQALNVQPGGTGFYIGSCNDRDYNSPACSNFCSSLAVSEITYNATAQRWQCCGLDGQGRFRCDDPTNIRSRAPAPSALLQQYSASVSTFTASSTTTPPSSTSTMTTSSTTTSTPPPDDSDGLSTGAKVGAGIGGALGGLAIIALLIFFIWRHRRKETNRLPRDQNLNGDHGQYYDISKQGAHDPMLGYQPPGSQTPNKHHTPPVELSPQYGKPRSELPDTTGQRIQQSPQELP